MFNREPCESHESFMTLGKTRKKAPVLYDKYGTGIATDKKKGVLNLHTENSVSHADLEWDTDKCHNLLCISIPWSYCKVKESVI